MLFDLVVDCGYGKAAPSTVQRHYVARFVDPNNGYADMQATGVRFQLSDVTTYIHIEFWDRHGSPLGTLWLTPQDPAPLVTLPGTIGGFDISNECVWHIDNVSFQLAYDYDLVWSYTLPGGGQVARLTENDFTRTPALTYVGHLEGVASGTIRYSETNRYETSIGTGGYTQTTTREGSLGDPLARDKGFGGVWEVTPSATFPGSACPSYGGRTKRYYVVGSPLPETLVTPYLVSLYADGATPRLMTGIAEVESTYQQFRPFNRYGTREWWPNEPLGGGGSHVGLMMIDMANKKLNYPRLCFWNWKENAARGTQLFRDKLATARGNMKKIQRRNPGLRDLTPVELEKMALVLFGPYAPRGDERKRLTKQYYTVDDSTTPPSWKKNTAGNPQGVAYVDMVRSKCK